MWSTLVSYLSTRSEKTSKTCGGTTVRHLKQERHRSVLTMDTGSSLNFVKMSNVLFVSSDLERFLYSCGHRILCRHAR